MGRQILKQSPLESNKDYFLCNNTNLVKGSRNTSTTVQTEHDIKLKVSTSLPKNDSFTAIPEITISN